MSLRIGSLMLVLLASGCGRTVVGAAAVRHPLHVGTVEANVVELGRMPARDRAALVELTADRICTEVELWGRNERHSRAIVENYDIGLVADDDTVEQRNPTVVHGAPHADLTAARRRNLYFPSSLCFPNSGFVSMSTRRLRLELRPRGRGRALVFHWELVPAAQETQPVQPSDPNGVPGRSPQVFATGAPATVTVTVR